MDERQARIVGKNFYPVSITLAMWFLEYSQVQWSCRTFESNNDAKLYCSSVMMVIKMYSNGFFFSPDARLLMVTVRTVYTEHKNPKTSDGDRDVRVRWKVWGGERNHKMSCQVLILHSIIERREKVSIPFDTRMAATLCLLQVGITTKNTES